LVKKLQAAESLSLDQALERLPESRVWMAEVLARVKPFVENGPLDVLEVGCAQGRGLLALAELGHRPVGLDPYEPALRVAESLAERHGTTVETILGVAESIPCPSERFDLVVAFSVIEHVDDLQASFGEIHRVLRPGGVFWFICASSMCPRQNEISHVPLFGWYPNRLKRAIMVWARDNRPAWVGHTQRPAIQWLTPWSARRELRAVGFGDVHDRWDLHAVPGGVRGDVFRLIRRAPPLKLVADMIIPGLSFAAVKPRAVDSKLV
jgi:SAM-dependent methyltransferase